MNIIDAVIIIFLMIGFLIGLRRGVVKEAVTLIGFLLIIILSYYFKDIIASFCFKVFPFIDFKYWGAVSIVNIIFYELVSFLFTASILIVAFRILLKLTGIIEKIFDFTIILGFISKILGGLLGVFEMYVILFIALFLFNQPFLKITGIEDSKYSEYIVNNTPILTKKVEGYIVVVSDLYNLKDKYVDKNFEKESIEKFLKYKILDVNSLKILKDKNKINFDGLDELIERYE